MRFILNYKKNRMLNTKKPLHKRNGFTLIEMIVVLGILGILLTIATPSLQYYSKKTSEATLDSTTKAVYTVVVNKMVDSTGTNVTEVLNFSNNPDLFSVQNLTWQDVHFEFTTNTDATINNLNTILTANPDQYIVLVPVVNTTDMYPDFTQNVYVAQPNTGVYFINGAKN